MCKSCSIGENSQCASCGKIVSWRPIATAPRDGTEILVTPQAGYTKALFMDGFWFWSDQDDVSIAAGPEPHGWQPLSAQVGSLQS